MNRQCGIGSLPIDLHPLPIENELIEFWGEDSCEHGPVECRERLGGLLNYYSRAA